MFNNIRNTLYPFYYIKTIFRLINWPIANCASVITFCQLLSLVINLFSTNIAFWHQWTSQSESFLKCPNDNWRNIIMNFQDIQVIFPFYLGRYLVVSSLPFYHRINQIEMIWEWFLPSLKRFFIWFRFWFCLNEWRYSGTSVFNSMSNYIRW